MLKIAFKGKRKNVNILQNEGHRDVEMSTRYQIYKRQIGSSDYRKHTSRPKKDKQLIILIWIYSLSIQYLI